MKSVQRDRFQLKEEETAIDKGADKDFHRVKRNRRRTIALAISGEQLEEFGP